MPVSPAPRLPPHHRRALPSTAATTSSSASSTVRRNLFQPHLSRRPTGASSLSSSSSQATSALGNPSDSSSLDSDILARNANGEYVVIVPGLSLSEGGAGAGMGAGEELGDDAGGGDEEQEGEGNIESRLAEMLNSRTRQSSEQELVDAVRKSLRRKVDALAEDEWIFEGHDGTI